MSSPQESNYAADATAPASSVPAQDTTPYVPGAQETVASQGTSTNEPSNGPTSIEDIESQVDQQRAKQGLPTLDESMDVPVDTSPDLLAPLRERVEQQPHLTGGKFDWGWLLSDMYGLGQSALYGLGEFGQQTTITTSEVSESLGKSLIRGLFTIGGADQATMDKLNAPDGPGLDEQRKQFNESIPNIAEILGIPKPDNAAENIVASVTPIIASYYFGTKVLEGLGVVSKLSSVEIPGVLGQGLARLGITGAGASKTMLEMLKSAAAVGSVMPEDSGNFADMLNGFTGRNDALGGIARSWIKYVPGESALIHDEEDAPLTRRFKNGLDAAYGEIIGPLAYLTLRNAKVGALAAKGLVDSASLARSAGEQQLVNDVLEKLGKDTSNETALNYLFGEADATSGTLQEGTLDTTPPQGEVKPSLGKTLMGFVKKTGAASDKPLDTAPNVQGATNETLPSWENLSAAEKAKRMLSWSSDETLQRIQEAQQKQLEAYKAAVAELKNYNNRYQAFINETGAATAKGFDKEGFFQHLQDAASSDDPNALKQAIGDWAQFTKEGPKGTLLNPDQVAAWNRTPMDVTGNIIESVKRLTTTNAARKDDAIKYLAEMMGNPNDTDYRDMARRMLSGTAEASGHVDNASRLLLSNRLFVSNSLLPDLETTVNVLNKMPEDIDTQRTALAILKRINQFDEANKNLKSAAGRLLQSTQIDPELEANLRAIYGPEQYRAYFNPSSVSPEVSTPLAANAADDLADTLNSTSPLSASERAQLSNLQRHWGVIDDSAKADYASSVFRSGQHPVWKYLGGSANLTFEVMGNLVMSAMLFHPATWSRVLQGSMTGVLYDSAAQGLLRGKMLDDVTADTLKFGSLWRSLSLPYSLLVAGKSFVRPAWQDIYALKTNLYKPQQILGPEMFTRSFGKDFATKLFAAAGGVPGRVLRTAGMGLGFPGHILGSLETMINHGALSSRLAEELYSQARTQGLSGKDALDHVFTHISDVMEDAIVAKSVPKGNIALRNKVGLDAEALRNLVTQADNNAAYTSLRETGMTKGPFATTRLGDTMPFKIERGISDWISNVPVVGPTLRGSLVPFTRVSANMLSRSLTPAQVILDSASRLVLKGGGPSNYINEAMSGLHGPHRQAQLLGHSTIAAALTTLGLANMFYLQRSGKAVNYPLGPSAQSEAGSELGVRYGETPLPDGGTVTTLGLNPFVTPFNLGNYAEWIGERYGIAPLTDSGPLGNEARLHIGQLAEVAAPIAPLYQGLGEVFGSLSNNEAGSAGTVRGIMTGLASGIGNALERPLRLRDLAPGKQVAGRSSSVTSAGMSKAFLTAMGGDNGDPNINRINSYNSFGEPIPDKYDPDNQINQFLEAYGFPSYRPHDDSSFGQFMGQLESHGITLPKAPNKLNLRVGGSPDTTPINMQLFYNPKTHEHLWDVYNRFVREAKTTSWVRTGDTHEMSLKEAMNELAGQALKDGGDSGASRVVRIGNYRKRVLSDAANKMTVNLAVARDWAKSKLEVYLVEHPNEFVDDSGQTLEGYSELIHRPNPLLRINAPS